MRNSTIRRVIAWDTETERFRPGSMAPELACITWDSITEGRLRASPDIEHWTRSENLLRGWLTDPGIMLVGQNMAYDTAVVGAQFPDLIPAIFQAYKENRITDTMIREQLWDIARGKYRGYMASNGEWVKVNYRLDDLVRFHTGESLKKDGWRTRYGEFRDVPLAGWLDKAKDLQLHADRLLKREQYITKEHQYFDGLDPKDLLAIVNDAPEQALAYPLKDASSTLDVYLAQEAAPPEMLHSQFREARAAFALHLSTVWGIRTNAAGVDELEKQTIAAIAEVKDRLMAEGLVRADGSRDTKKAADYMITVCDREGLDIRRTKKGGVSLDQDACEATEDALMEAYSDYSVLGKTLNADIPMLRAGTLYPIHARYGIADTDRTTCSSPNLQNLRKLPGIREAIQARPGKVLIQADFPQLELYTLAEVCYSWFGHSALGDLLKAGVDPHTAFAAQLAGISYEEGLVLRKNKDKEFDKLRQIAKAFNFGKPGGLGPKKLVTLAASAAYKVTITEAEARRYGKQWLEMFPEMREYFDRANATIGEDQKGTVVIPNTGFIRGGAKYCAVCNTPFQGLGAACAKHAMWLVAEAEYVDTNSALFGSRTIAMIHDEIIAETDDGPGMHDAAFELARLMVKGANEFLPHCPIPESKMEPTAMRMWSKNAFQMFDSNGRLVAWNGEKHA